MNNAMTISVTCKDEETKAKYEVLAAKMKEDTEFQAGLNLCKNDKDVYDLYVKHGYTDLCFEDFCVEFKETIDGIVNVQSEGTFELTEAELDNVVGGFSWFKFLTSVVSVIPIAGPLIAGVAKAVKAGIEGKGMAEVVKQVAVGVGLALVDTAVMIGTGGVGSGAAMAIKVGMAGVKAGLNSALE